MRLASDYPELLAVAESLADKICEEINQRARHIESAMPYKTQFILEQTVTLLARRI